MSTAKTHKTKKTWTFGKVAPKKEHQQSCHSYADLQAEELREILAQSEMEVQALQDEQAELRAKIIELTDQLFASSTKETLAKETQSKESSKESSKLITTAVGAYRTALQNLQVLTTQAEMRVRDSRDRLQRLEGVSIAFGQAHKGPPVTPGSFLDDILKGKLPASTGERIMAARTISGLPGGTPTEEDPAKAVEHFKGLWGASS